MRIIAIELNTSHIKFKFSAQYEREHTVREPVFTSPPLTSTLLVLDSLVSQLTHVKIHENINRILAGSKKPKNAARPKYDPIVIKIMISQKLMHKQEQMLQQQVICGCQFFSRHTQILLIINLTQLGINVLKVNMQSIEAYIKKKVSKERCLSLLLL